MHPVVGEDPRADSPVEKLRRHAGILQFPPSFVPLATEVLRQLKASCDYSSHYGSRVDFPDNAATRELQEALTAEFVASEGDSSGRGWVVSFSRANDGVPLSGVRIERRVLGPSFEGGRSLAMYSMNGEPIHEGETQLAKLIWKKLALPHEGGAVRWTIERIGGQTTHEDDSDSDAGARFSEDEPTIC